MDMHIYTRYTVNNEYMYAVFSMRVCDITLCYLFNFSDKRSWKLIFYSTEECDAYLATITY